MTPRTQLLALLFCAMLAVGVLADSPNSQIFCCQKSDGTCDPQYSGYAGSGRNPVGVTGSSVADCNSKYGGRNQPNVQGKLCLDLNDDGISHCVPDVAGATEDPHIRGLDGSSYILWGKNNTIYNLLSERNHHINVRLYHPAGHPDTQALYIDAVGLLFHSARLAITMVKAAPASYLTLSINDGPPFAFPGHIVDRAVDGLTAYSFRSPQKVTISSRDIVLSVVLAEDFYINVMVDEVAANWGDVHGVLGQTHRAAFQLRYNYARGTAVGELPAGDAQRRDKTYTIQGQEDDYVASGLLKADDKFSRFVAPAKTVSRKLFNELAAATTLPRKEAGSRVRTNAGLLV